jgi:hypothetical protein
VSWALVRFLGSGWVKKDGLGGSFLPLYFTSFRLFELSGFAGQEFKGRTSGSHFCFTY